MSKVGWSPYFFKLRPYLDHSFLLSSFKSPTSYVAILLFIIAYRMREKITWDSFQASVFLKIMFIVPGFLLCWEMFDYDYNYFLDNSFLFERILMFILLVLIWFHPMYAILFLMVALMFRAQFDFPLGGFPIFEKKILFDAYIILIVFLFMKNRLKLTYSSLLLFFIVLVAGNYFATAIGKMQVSSHWFNWATTNPLHIGVLHGIQRGWILSTDWINWISINAWWMQWIVFLLECSVLFICFKRKLALFLLSGCILMHFGIFFFSGAFFWKWIIVDALLIVSLSKQSWWEGIFNRKNFVTSIWFISTAALWSSAYTIGWLDTRFNQTFEYSVVTNTGSEYVFGKNQFSPYHQVFLHDKFFYLVNAPLIKISAFGYTFDPHLQNKINRTDIQDIAQLETEVGKNFYSPKKDSVHSEFIRSFFKVYNARLINKKLNHSSFSPNHFYNYSSGRLYQDQNPVQKVKIFLKKSFVQDNEVHCLEKRLIKIIEIPTNNR